jgi:hypothetical protein
MLWLLFLLGAGVCCKCGCNRHDCRCRRRDRDCDRRDRDCDRDSIWIIRDRSNRCCRR